MLASLFTIGQKCQYLSRPLDRCLFLILEINAGFFRIEPLREAAIGHSEELGHRVHEHMEAMEPLVQSSIQAASVTYDTKSLTVIFEQCKTVIEAELQMLYACRNISGNPKVFFYSV